MILCAWVDTAGLDCWDAAALCDATLVCLQAELSRIRGAQGAFPHEVQEKSGGRGKRNKQRSSRQNKMKEIEIATLLQPEMIPVCAVLLTPKGFAGLPTAPLDNARNT